MMSRCTACGAFGRIPLGRGSKLSNYICRCGGELRKSSSIETAAEGLSFSDYCNIGCHATPRDMPWNPNAEPGRVYIG